MIRWLFALAAVLITAAVGLPSNTQALSLDAAGYYTWGIDPDEVSIPDGYIITDAEIQLHGLTSVSENLADTLVIYLLDNPPVGFHINTDLPGVDHFAPHGCRLTPDYTDRVKGYETITFRASAIDDATSWVWRVYERPFSFHFHSGVSVLFSSTVLELMDYVGNGTPFGIGLDPAGTAGFTLVGLSLTLTIQSFQESSNATQIRFAYGDTNSPPILYAPSLRVVPEGAPLQVTFSATDPDGDSVQLSCAGLPAGATFANGIFSWTPPFETASRGAAVPFAIIVTADDGASLASRTLVIWVFNTNRPPLLAGLTLLSEEKTRLVYKINAIDPDGDPLTCWAVQLPPDAVLDPVTNTIQWDIIAAAPGTYDVTLTVSDGLLDYTQTFPIEVSAMDRTVLTDRQSSLRSR